MMTSSSKKISESVEDPTKDEEHNWDRYLIETNSEAAPAANFKQSLIPPKNDFTIGEKLETIDPRNQDAWCIGTVIGAIGPRIRIRLDGTDDRNDFWRLVDSADIRPYGTTAKLSGQIVPPLGFQQTSTRWAKYFEKHVKNGPFADESCFKSQPAKPEKNLFQKGQKLEAVDPRHSELICPATVNSLIPGDRRIILSLDGWSTANNFKVDYFSREIFPVGWCKSAGIRIAKIGGLPPARAANRTLSATPEKQSGSIRQSVSKTKKSTLSSVSNLSSYSPTPIDDDSKKMMKTSSIKKERLQFDQTQANSSTKALPIVTVYWNYAGDNGGMLLNPQRFHSSMPSIFGPSDCNSILKSILDSCVKCSFQPTSFINRIRDLFSVSNPKKNSSTQIELENRTLVNIPSIEKEDEFWEVIRVFENGILAGNDLFISTPPSTVNLSNGSSLSLGLSNVKRKNRELNSENTTFLTNGKASRSTSKEKSVYDAKSSFKKSQLRNNTENQSQAVSLNGLFHHAERFTPSDVAAFIRRIDPSFNNLASRFLQEEIDGKALLLLTTDTLMRHLGLKLGPSLKIIDHIEKLKNKEHF